MDVALAGLDDRISVGDDGDLTAQPQRRAANQYERDFLGSKDSRTQHCGRERGQEHSQQVEGVPKNQVLQAPPSGVSSIDRRVRIGHRRSATIEV